MYLFQVNLIVPVSYLLFWALLLGFSLYSEPVVCGVGLVIMLTGVPVYFLGVHWKEKPKCIYDFIGEFKLLLEPNCFCILQPCLDVMALQVFVLSRDGVYSWYSCESFGRGDLTGRKTVLSLAYSCFNSCVLIKLLAAGDQRGLFSNL